MNKSIEDMELAGVFSTRERLLNVLNSIPEDKLVLIGYIDDEQIIRPLTKKDLEPTQELIQQALDTNNKEWVERIQKLPTGMFDSTPYKDELLAAHSKENV
jgi:hypothetical protein